MKTHQISYKCQNETMIGYHVSNPKLKISADNPRPLVIVCHDWSGCNEFALEKATDLAKLGYISFAIDMYGNGRCGSTTQEKSSLMSPLMDDRALIIARMQAGLSAARNLVGVNHNQVAVIGFCFGGLCAIDLLRSGEEICGVVSFHGLLTPLPVHLKAATSSAKLLLLHGYEDCMVKPHDVMLVADEMTDLGVDWQINMYGHAMHAFANKQAQDPSAGILYNSKIAERAWQSMHYFLQEIFNEN